jgi:hypothetical protein
VTTKPDFLRAVNRKAKCDPIGEYYQSPNLLGRLHRTFCEIDYAIPQVIANDGLQRAIAAAQNLVPTRNTVFLERKDEVDRQMEELFRTELRSYRECLRGQNILQNSEINVFLRKQLDVFPDHIISGLVHQIMRVICSEHYLSSSSHYQRPIYSVEDVEQVFRLYLFQA